MTDTAPMTRPHPYSDPNGWCGDVADPQLTQHGPPVRVPEPNGAAAWLVTRYPDVRTVLSDRRFGRAPTARMEPPRVSPARFCRATMLTTAEPPEHTRLRRLFNDAFTAAQAERWQPRAQQLLDTNLDRIAETGSTADLVRQVFDPFTVTLLAEIIGVPNLDRAQLVALSGALHATNLSAKRFHDQIDAVAQQFDDLVARRRQTPADDAISHALQLRDTRGDDTTDADIASMGAGMFATGVFALTGQLQISTHALLSHPAEAARLRAQPRLLPRAVNELLRYAPLIIGPLRPRYVVHDIEVGGQMLRAGELAAASSSAANFDPTFFPDPYRLDVTRQSAPILTFGFGIHFCQATSLARMALSTVVSTLTKRFPNLRLAVPNERLRWVQARRLRSFEQLPVTWSCDDQLNPPFGPLSL